MSKENEIIAFDESSDDLPKISLLERYIRTSNRPFLTEGIDAGILEQISQKTPEEIQQSAQSIFYDLLKENGDNNILVCGNAMTLAVCFNNPKQAIMLSDKADDLDSLLWQPFIAKVFMGGEKMGEVSARIIRFGSGIDPEKRKFAYTIALQTTTKEGERKNRFRSFAWLPNGKPDDVFGDDIRCIGGRLVFIDTEGERMLIKPVFFKEARYLTLSIMADVSGFFETGGFNGRIYLKRNPCLTESLQITHRTHLGQGKSWPTDLVIYDEKNNFFFVEKLL